MTSRGTSRKAPSGWASEPDPGDELRPGDVVDGYTIQKEIGRGGMGVVYLAKEERTGRLCALKQIRGDLAHRPDALERFKTEGTILAQLEHPCIVTLYTTGTHQGRPYLVMQWIKGKPLRELMQNRRAPFPLTQALSIAIQIGTALKAAHRQGIVHRDLKPENVIIQRDGTVKVVDFGIGKLRDGVTTTDRLRPLLTPLYAAPEQLARGPVDERADVYALGLLIVEMPTGRHAFCEMGETMPSDAMGAAYQAGARPNRLIDNVVDCPESLSAIVDRALSKDPARRPDMGPFVSALRSEQRGLRAVKSDAGKPEEEDDSDEEEEERDKDAPPAPARRGGTAPMPANHVAGSPFAAFAPQVFRPVDRTVRMTSASAQLATQGKTLERARTEARARPAPPASGRWPCAAASSAVTTSLPLGARDELVIPRPSIEVAIPRPSLQPRPIAALTRGRRDGQRAVPAQSAEALLASQGKTLAQARAEAHATGERHKLRTLAAVGVALTLALALVALVARVTRSLTVHAAGVPVATTSSAAAMSPATPSPSASTSRRPSDVR